VKEPVDIFIEIAEDYLALNLGGMFYTNQLSGHFVSDNDIEFITEFYRMNMNSELPVYPKKSYFEEHHILSQFGMNN